MNTKNEYGKTIDKIKKYPPEKMMQNGPRIHSKALLTSLFRHFLFFKKVIVMGPQGPQGPGTGTIGTRDQGPGTRGHIGRHIGKNIEHVENRMVYNSSFNRVWLKTVITVKLALKNCIDSISQTSNNIFLHPCCAYVHFSLRTPWQNFLFWTT